MSDEDDIMPATHAHPAMRAAAGACAGSRARGDDPQRVVRAYASTYASYIVHCTDQAGRDLQHTLRALGVRGYGSGTHALAAKPASEI
jgi:hypothetical protein